MKKYTVNVHFDAVYTVTVDADNEVEALAAAEDKALEAELGSYDFFLSDSCVTFEEDTPDAV